MNFDQNSALLIFVTFLGRAFVGPRKRDATFFSDDAHRFRKRALLHFHDEFEDVATLPAAKAVVNLLGRMNVERRGLLGVKRAKATKVLPRFLELNVIADNADDVRLLLDLFRE